MGVLAIIYLYYHFISRDRWLGFVISLRNLKKCWKYLIKIIGEQRLPNRVREMCCILHKQRKYPVKVLYNLPLRLSL